MTKVHRILKQDARLSDHMALPSRGVVSASMAAGREEEYTAIADAAQSLISLISRRQQQPESSGQGGRGQPPRSTSVGTSQVPTIQNEMQRSFPGYFRRETIRSKKRPAALSKISPAIAIKYVRIQFLVLSCPTDRTPKPSEEIKLLEAGLGKRTMTVADNSGHEEIVCQLEEQYPKLKQLSGGWLCYKSTGGQGQRKLSVVATESEGYTGKLLKTVSNNGKLILYIVPLQEELDASPLPHDSPEFSKMPKSSCKNCGVVMPLQFLALHIKSCNAEIISDEPEIVSIEEKEVNTTEVCPICERIFPREDIVYHASFCGDGFPEDTLMPFHEDDAGEGTSSTVDPTGVVNEMAGPSTVLADPTVPGWKQIINASSAAILFRRVILREQQLEMPLRFSMDLHSEVEEREKAVISFYKTPRTKWASPIHCVLGGDAAIGEGVSRYFISFAMQTLQSGFHINFGNADVTRLFEGQTDHLIPCASQSLIDSDLFLMAGRMVGHSFIHGGPGLAGISPAVVHVLLGGQLETATLVLEDCPNIDQRNTIQLLEGNRELSEDQKADVNSLADMWELPRLTNLNRQYLHQRLLQHAILGRTTSQIKQMRKGLKETGVWSILSERRDVAEVVFPCEKDIICSPQVMIDHITWPTSEVVEDDDDEEFPLETRAKIGTYLRHFIETAPAASRRNLLKFWTGWEVLSGKLKLEVVRGEYPKSSTCYQSLRIPGHFSTYEELKQALEASIGTSDTGFGLI